MGSRCRLKGYSFDAEKRQTMREPAGSNKFNVVANVAKRGVQGGASAFCCSTKNSSFSSDWSSGIPLSASLCYLCRTHKGVRSILMCAQVCWTAQEVCGEE